MSQTIEEIISNKEQLNAVKDFASKSAKIHGNIRYFL